MVNRAAILALFGCIAVIFCAGPASCLDLASSAAPSRGGLVRTPVAFVQNAGQESEPARFAVRGPSGSALFGACGVEYAVGSPGQRACVTLEFVAPSPSLRLEGVDRLRARVNYLVGADKAGWKRNIPSYAGVSYREVWPGVDVVFRGSGGNLKYDILAEPGADVESIALRFAGADSVTLGADGRLTIATGDKAFTESIPAVYQIKDQERSDIGGRFTLNGDVVGFSLEGYDPSLPLVIDPASDLNWSVLISGSQYDSGQSVFVDGAGNCYAAGDSASPDLPGSSARPYSAMSDGWVAKFSPAAELVYLTYLGGSDDDYAKCVIADAAGGVHVAGYTESHDFPTTPGVIGPEHHDTGHIDGFVAKLGPDGDELVYSTFFGGALHDWVLGLALDSDERAVICGQTSSVDLPVTPDALDGTFNGSFDAFVARLNSDATAVLYCTYFGGSNTDWATCIKLDSAGGACIGGLTQSTNFPVHEAFVPSLKGSFDGFVTRFESDLATVVFSTYLGGTGQDAVHAIAIDGSSWVYATGTTAGGGFPVTVGAVAPVYGGGTSDGFDTCFTPAGGAQYSTFVGGAGADAGHGIAVDASQRAYVVGQTGSSDFPATAGAYSTSLGGVDDAFLVRVNATGSAFDYATYLGGSQSEMAKAVAVDAEPSAYVVGLTSSSDFPATSVLTNAQAAVYDVNAFLARLLAPPPPDTTPPSAPVVTDDGVVTTSGVSLHASWSSTDAESGVASYEYAIGTSPSDPGEGYVAPWTAAGPAESWTVDTLTLQPGTRYYWYVRATNGADLVSDVGVSDGIVPVSVAAETPAEAKLEADGVFLSAAGTVTATSAQLDGRIYIEAPDRSSGIACLSTDACAVGDSVIVAGTMATDGGERVISGAGILASQAAVPVAPHTMTLRSVAGGDFFYDAQTGAGQRGVSIPEGSGLNGVGLLVAVAGWVSEVGEDYISLKDGSVSGSGQIVAKRNLPAEVRMGSYVSAVGVLSMQQDEANYLAVLLVRRPEDVTLVIP